MKKIPLILLIFFMSTNICFGAAATMYVTPAGAGAKDGAAWASAMGYGEWEADMEASTEAGDVYYVAGGTYTLTSDFTVTNDGTTTAPITIIGVKSGTTNEPPVAADWATGDDRPLITDGASAYTFTFDDYTIIRNIRMTGSDTDSIRADVGSIVANCYASNDGTATNQAINIGGNGGMVIGCEATSTNGIAIKIISGGRALYNYIHDSVDGIEITTSDFCTIAGNIIDTCTTGITSDGSNPQTNIIGNTIYNGTTGILRGGTSEGWVVMHNIISTFTTGVSSAIDATGLTGNWDYNDYYDNTTDRTATNVPVGIFDVDTDPQFPDAAGGNFNLGANLDDKGLDQPGDSSSAHLEIGACMYEETGGASGGRGTGWINL